MLVAPPKDLGMIRTELLADVRSRIVAESHKTLTHEPVQEIERLVALL